MLLVLCDPRDTSALWAGQGLRERGMKAVEFVSPTEIVCTHRFEYCAEQGEPVRATVELAGGRRIDTRRLLGTLNRATRVDFPQVRQAAPADRAYVQSEMDAIFLAWLGALASPVFNPPQPSGWGGALLHPFAWALHAQRAGFATLPYRCGYSGLEIPVVQNSHITSHIVFAGRSFPALSDDLQKAAERLSEGSGVPLLGIVLQWSADGHALFCGATPQPNLRTGGSVFLDALSAAFAGP